MINMNPNMLPVHCCCDPAVRLGWVPLYGERREKAVRYIVRQKMSVLIGVPKRIDAEEIVTEIARLHIPVRLAEPYQCSERKLHQTIPVWKEILAVKSNDYPIEKWRKVAGFVEERHAQGYLDDMLQRGMRRR